MGSQPPNHAQLRLMQQVMFVFDNMLLTSFVWGLCTLLQVQVLHLDSPLSLAAGVGQDSAPQPPPPSAAASAVLLDLACLQWLLLGQLPGRALDRSQGRSSSTLSAAAEIGAKSSNGRPSVRLTSASRRISPDHVPQLQQQQQQHEGVGSADGGGPGAFSRSVSIGGISIKGMGSMSGRWDAWGKEGNSSSSSSTSGGARQSSGLGMGDGRGFSRSLSRAYSSRLQHLGSGGLEAYSRKNSTVVAGNTEGSVRAGCSSGLDFSSSSGAAASSGGGGGERATGDGSRSGGLYSSTAGLLNASAPRSSGLYIRSSSDPPGLQAEPGAVALVNELSSLKAGKKWLRDKSQQHRKQQKVQESAFGQAYLAAPYASESYSGSRVSGVMAVADTNPLAGWPSPAVAAVARGAEVPAVAGVVVAAAALMQHMGVAVPEGVARAAQQQLVNQGWLPQDAAAGCGVGGGPHGAIKGAASAAAGVDFGVWHADGGHAALVGEAGSGDGDLADELVKAAAVHASLWSAVGSMGRWSSALSMWQVSVMEELSSWAGWMEKMIREWERNGGGGVADGEGEDIDAAREGGFEKGGDAQVREAGKLERCSLSEQPSEQLQQVREGDLPPRAAAAAGSEGQLQEQSDGGLLGHGVGSVTGDAAAFHPFKSSRASVVLPAAEPSGNFDGLGPSDNHEEELCQQQAALSRMQSMAGRSMSMRTHNDEETTAAFGDEVGLTVEGWGFQQKQPAVSGGLRPAEQGEDLGAEGWERSGEGAQAGVSLRLSDEHNLGGSPTAASNDGSTFGSSSSFGRGVGSTDASANVSRRRPFGLMLEGLRYSMGFTSTSDGAGDAAHSGYSSDGGVVRPEAVSFKSVGGLSMQARMSSRLSVSGGEEEEEEEQGGHEGQPGQEGDWGVSTKAAEQHVLEAAEQLLGEPQPTAGAAAATTDTSDVLDSSTSAVGGAEGVGDAHEGEQNPVKGGWQGADGVGMPPGSAGVPAAGAAPPDGAGPSKAPAVGILTLRTASTARGGGLPPLGGLGRMAQGMLMYAGAQDEGAKSSSQTPTAAVAAPRTVADGGGGGGGGGGNPDRSDSAAASASNITSLSTEQSKPLGSRTISSSDSSQQLSRSGYGEQPTTTSSSSDSSGTRPEGSNVDMAASAPGAFRLVSSAGAAGDGGKGGAGGGGGGFSSSSSRKSRVLWADSQSGSADNVGSAAGAEAAAGDEARFATSSRGSRLLWADSQTSSTTSSSTTSSGHGASQSQGSPGLQIGVSFAGEYGVSEAHVGSLRAVTGGSAIDGSGELQMQPSRAGVARPSGPPLRSKSMSSGRGAVSSAAIAGIVSTSTSSTAEYRKMGSMKVPRGVSFAGGDGNEDAAEWGVATGTTGSSRSSSRGEVKAAGRGSEEGGSWKAASRLSRSATMAGSSMGVVGGRGRDMGGDGSNGPGATTTRLHRSATMAGSSGGGGDRLGEGSVIGRVSALGGSGEGGSSRAAPRLSSSVSISSRTQMVSVALPRSVSVAGVSNQGPAGNESGGGAVGERTGAVSGGAVGGVIGREQFSSSSGGGSGGVSGLMRLPRSVSLATGLRGTGALQDHSIEGALVDGSSSRSPQQFPRGYSFARGTGVTTGTSGGAMQTDELSAMSASSSSGTSDSRPPQQFTRGYSFARDSTGRSGSYAGGGGGEERRGFTDGMSSSAAQTRGNPPGSYAGQQISIEGSRSGVRPMGPFMVSRALAASLQKREEVEEAEKAMSVPGQSEGD